MRLIFTKTTKPMKTLIVCLLVMAAFSSCSRALTPDQAANNHYKKCRDIR
jgi:hypothetical protein